MKLSASPAIQCAHRLLFIPDLFNYWLTGQQRAEVSIASTSQFYNPAKRQWATGLFRRLGLPESVLPEIVPSGTPLGPLLAEIAASARLPGDLPPYSPASPDTPSAVAAYPPEA